MIAEYADAASLGGFYDTPGTETGLEGLFGKLFKPLESLIAHNKGTIGTLAPIVGGAVGSIIPGVGTMLGGAVGGIVGNLLPMVAGVGGAPVSVPNSATTIDPETGSPVGVTLVYAPVGAPDLVATQVLPNAQKATLGDGRTLYALPPGQVNILGRLQTSLANFTPSARTTAAGSTIINLVATAAPSAAQPGAAVPGSINTGAIMLLGGLAVALLLARRS